MAALTLLLNREDQAGLRVHQAFLHRYGVESMQMIDGEALVSASCWSQSLGGQSRGRMQTRIRLADGQEVRLTSDTVVFNRLRRVDHSGWGPTNPLDRHYAIAEWHALLLGWLESLPCRVINPPMFQGLAGGEYSDVQWVFLAQRAELPVRDFLFASTARYGGHYRQGIHARPEVVEGRLKLMHLKPLGRWEWLALGHAPTCCLEEVKPGPVVVLVIGSAVLGEIPKKLKVGCVKLARLVGCELLQIWFAPGKRAGDWYFLTASTFPDLAGDGHVEGVVAYLAEQTGVGRK